MLPADIEPLVNHLIQILQRTAPCQIDEDDEEEGAAAGEQSEYDAALISAACDLVGTIATVLGEEFAPMFPTFLPAMKQYYVCRSSPVFASPSLMTFGIQDVTRSSGDRSTAIGSLAEIVNGMGAGVSPFTSDLFTLFLGALNDPETEVQSNAAFAMGSLVLATTTDISSQYLTILGALHPLFEIGVEAKKDNARDNACGAVARMILKNQAALPLDQVSTSSLPLA